MEMHQQQQQQDRRIVWMLAGFFFVALLLSYSNHYNNSFHFDDHHTITGNKDIRDLSDPMKFFRDGTTGTNKGGINYRPLVALMNAVDYNLAGNEYDTYYFHRSIFFWYVVQLICMFFLFRNILNISHRHRWNNLIALFITALYGLHTTNAETINYIIARSDSFSTLWMVVGILMYQYKFTRKFHLYLIPMIIGLFTKQTGIMFPPLLFVYIMLFDEKISLTDPFGAENRKKLGRTILKSLPAFVVGLGIFIFNQKVMTPLAGYNTGRSKFWYLITQTYVIATYLGNFILPVGLTIECDFHLLDSVLSSEAIIGFVVNGAMIALALWAFRRFETYPITYGIIWMYLAFVPTSSIIPRFQIANHHRMFFPFVGLVLAVGWVIGWWAIRNEKKVEKTPLLKWGLPIAATAVILAYGYGTYQRNFVWATPATAWEDAVQKSPESGRVLKYWADILAGRKDYDEAAKYYDLALVQWPRNPGLHMSMVNFKMKHRPDATDEEIEEHFKKATDRGQFVPHSYQKYAKWLMDKERYKDAKKITDKGIKKIKPKTDSHKKAVEKLEKLKVKIDKEYGKVMAEDVDSMEQLIVNEPKKLKHYKRLCDVYYKMGEYEKCIETAQRGFTAKERDAGLWNFICVSHNKMAQWDKGIEACKKGIEINDKIKRLHANLEWAEKGKAEAAGGAKKAEVKIEDLDTEDER